MMEVRSMAARLNPVGLRSKTESLEILSRLVRRSSAFPRTTGNDYGYVQERRGQGRPGDDGSTSVDPAETGEKWCASRTSTQQRDFSFGPPEAPEATRLLLLVITSSTWKRIMPETSGAEFDLNQNHVKLSREKVRHR